MEMRQGFAAVNGTRLYFQVVGAGHPIIFLHGFAGDSRLFDDQFEVFAQYCQAIRYDLRGFGKSDLPNSEPYRHIDDLHALLEYLGISRVDLAGQSSGGAISIEFALVHPAMTRALILLDSTLGGFEHSREFEAWFAFLGAQANESGVEAAKARLLDTPFLESARAKADVARRLEQSFSEYSGWHWFNEDPQSSLEPPAIQRLEQIHAPTLIITGERTDPDLRSIADLLQARIPNARKFVLDRVGHVPNMEDPRIVNKIVLDFLASLSRV
jgi:pimeloyl-ACP methyl ester carboxylesterase